MGPNHECQHANRAAELVLLMLLCFGHVAASTVQGRSVCKSNELRSMQTELPFDLWGQSHVRMRTDYSSKTII